MAALLKPQGSLTFIQNSEKTNAKGYAKSQEIPSKKYFEIPTVLRHICDLNNKTVLDMGCGVGKYCRLFIQLGAKSIVGYDISSQMIQRAKRMTGPVLDNISYHVGDVSHRKKWGSFDVVTCIWAILMIQKDTDFVSAFKNAYDNLNEGGQFYLFEIMHPGTEDGLEKLKIACEQVGNKLEVLNRDPAACRISLKIGNRTVTFDTYIRHEHSYKDAFKQAGFKDVKCLPVEPSKDAPQGLEGHAELAKYQRLWIGTK
eukprot:CAMPEP_0168524052 /NCGR_PEP_ID=MMETSP0405-20121227/10400_1 /TAXON_ID=498012 /ORGANISM="Trichosphaerium sp, Strain Am-I-7 wt" /LENGTH=256 /DNA_ID=CAMNT_0008546145 /DNA_START=20 /DNA_END=790 /DNA_ORIENTATION=+